MSDFRYQRTRWLWWMTFWLLLGGGALFWHLSTLGDTSEQTLILVGAGTLLAAGICIIAATSDWWFNH